MVGFVHRVLGLHARLWVRVPRQRHHSSSGTSRKAGLGRSFGGLDLRQIHGSRQHHPCHQYVPCVGSVRPLSSWRTYARRNACDGLMRGFPTWNLARCIGSGHCPPWTTVRGEIPAAVVGLPTIERAVEHSRGALTSPGSEPSLCRSTR